MAVSVIVVDPRPLVREALVRLLADYPEFQVETAAAELAELSQCVSGQQPSVALVGPAAWQPLDECTLAEHLRRVTAARVLILGDDYSEEAVCRLLMLGSNGYLTGDVSAEVFKKAILAIARGEIWAERHLVTRTLHQALAAAGSDATLTSREREILGLLRTGYSNRQIATQLFISPETVKWHMRKVFGKIGAKDRLQAALYARENNIFPRQERTEHPSPAQKVGDR